MQNGFQAKPLSRYFRNKIIFFTQVRRTVAALAAVAQGKVTLKDIKFMLEVPSFRSWYPQLKTFPAHGLYLCEVEYSKKDLASFKTTPEI